MKFGNISKLQYSGKSPGLRQPRGLRRMFRRAAKAALLLLSLDCLWPSPALAYLDPGTGSMLASAAIGIAATLLFFLKSSYYKIASAFFRLCGRSLPKERGELVFYSEGPQYWSTFQPVLHALSAMGQPALYLTSDNQDPGLVTALPHIKTSCIGQGNRAFAVLNMLEADLCVMTTPNLNVLQLSRSPGVRHYAHLVHACTDMAYYKLFAFDWFDSVLCAGPHQIRSLRHLEALRGTPRKLLLESGCCYMDAMADRLDQTATAPEEAADNKPRILVAPTWGANGLLTRFGSALLLPLARAGYEICVRPHPQSVRHETALLDDIRADLDAYPNISWDTETDGLPAMQASSVLISDLSGIVFDYAFILERPVITVRFNPENRGLEAADLPYPAWELGILPRLGAHIEPEDIARLPDIIAALPKPAVFAARIGALRDESLCNFRQSGEVVARQLLEIRENHARDEHLAVRPAE